MILLLSILLSVSDSLPPVQSTNYYVISYNDKVSDTINLKLMINEPRRIKFACDSCYLLIRKDGSYEIRKTKN